MFVASALAVKAAHEIDSSNQVGMMLAYRPLYTYTCDPKDQILVMEMQQDRHFYSDVMMNGEYPAYRLKRYEREGIKLEDCPEDYTYLKNTLVIFLAFLVIVAIQKLCIQKGLIQVVAIFPWG